jgi:MoaA/NifB/PqqE/SkfB family radical SAM enzyme
MIIPRKLKPKKSYQIIEATKKTDGFDSDYHVQIRITEACDLKCEYCYWYSGKHYKYEDIVTSIDKLFIFFHKVKFRRVVFYCHGGEATRHNKVYEILSYIKQKASEAGIEAYIEMQTNLSLPPAKLERLLPLFDRIGISYHFMELKTRGGGYKLKDFEDNFAMLEAKGLPVYNFDIMLENIPIELLSEFYERVEKYLAYKNILNSEMIYDYYAYNYSDEIRDSHLAFYKKHNKTERMYLIDDQYYTTNELFRRGVDFTGWRCDAGKRTMYLNGDGNVFVCSRPMTRYLQEQDVKDTFTNLVTDPLAVTKLVILHSSGSTCRWDICSGDYYVNKTKPPAE